MKSLDVSEHDRGHPEAVKPARLYSHHGWAYLYPARAGPDLTALVLRLAWLHVAPKMLLRAPAG